MAFERIEPWGYPVDADMLAGLANGALLKKDKSLFTSLDFMSGGERKKRLSRAELRNQVLTYLNLMGAKRVN